MRQRRIAVLAAVSLLCATRAGAVADVATEPHFLPMDEIAVPIVDGARVTGTLRVKLVLDGANAEAATRLGASLPVLRQAAIGAALDFARIRASTVTPVDVAVLDQDLTDALTGIDKGVGKVLIVEVSARRS